MENYTGMNKLVELIFGKKGSIPEENMPSIRDNWLTEEFSKKLRDVLLYKKLIVFRGWKDVLDKDIHTMLSSNTVYLVNIMLACLCEFEFSRNIFDFFISVCAIVIKWNEEILEKTGLNFCALNPDIFMVFYRKVLMKSFFESSRDFYRLVEYINGHKYLTRNGKTLILADPTPIKESNKRKKLGLIRSHCIISNDMTFINVENAIVLAQEALSTISVEFPTLPGDPDMIMRLVETRKKEMGEKYEIKERLGADLATEVPHKCSSNSVLLIRPTIDGTNHFESNQEDIVYENIVEAVIRHNRSINTGPENKNEKADGILEHLKDAIKSLAEVLDECRKE